MNGRKIGKVGGDLQELPQATCFELSTNELVRADQIHLNTDMVTAQEGLMAPVTGSVRYASITTGHCAGLCLAANARNITPETEPADSEGRVDTARLASEDPVLTTMFETGWMWLVLHASVELRWPDIPDIGQQELDCSLDVSSITSERESACIIADTAAQMQKHGKEVKWNACMYATLASALSCAPCMQYISEYVRRYAGEEGAPMAKFMAACDVHTGHDTDAHACPT